MTCGCSDAVPATTQVAPGRRAPATTAKAVARARDLSPGYGFIPDLCAKFRTEPAHLNKLKSEILHPNERPIDRRLVGQVAFNVVCPSPTDTTKSSNSERTAGPASPLTTISYIMTALSSSVRSSNYPYISIESAAECLTPSRVNLSLSSQRA